MAKKQGIEPLENPLESTTAAASGGIDLNKLPSVAAEGGTRPTGVGLKESELEQLKAIAGQYNVSLNALMRYGLRLFLALHQAGHIDTLLEADIKPPATAKNRLDMP